MKNKSSLAGKSVSATQVCPVVITLRVIGGKWKPAILWELQNHGVLRFGHLQRTVEGITQKMLTQQLRELETDGIIERKVYPEVPPRVEYQLTSYGFTLRAILNEMAKWGFDHRQVC
jgi:DNA-binding HxlR family transcriptional regulator